MKLCERFRGALKDSEVDSIIGEYEENEQ